MLGFTICFIILIVLALPVVYGGTIITKEHFATIQRFEEAIKREQEASRRLSQLLNQNLLAAQKNLETAQKELDTFIKDDRKEEK